MKIKEMEKAKEMSMEVEKVQTVKEVEKCKEKEVKSEVKKEVKKELKKEVRKEVKKEVEKEKRCEQPRKTKEEYSKLELERKQKEEYEIACDNEHMIKMERVNRRQDILIKMLDDLKNSEDAAIEAANNGNATLALTTTPPGHNNGKSGGSANGESRGGEFIFDMSDGIEERKNMLGCRKQSDCSGTTDHDDDDDEVEDEDDILERIERNIRVTKQKKMMLDQKESLRRENHKKDFIETERRIKLELNRKSEISNGRLFKGDGDSKTSPRDRERGCERGSEREDSSAVLTPSSTDIANMKIIAAAQDAIVQQEIKLRERIFLQSELRAKADYERTVLELNWRSEDEIDGLNRTLELQRLLYFEQEKRRVRIRALMKSVSGNSKNAYQYGGLKLEF